MTAVSYGGELNLKPDGTYDYKFSSASGQVGQLQFAGDKDSGRWRLEGSELIVARSSGKDMRTGWRA